MMLYIVHYFDLDHREIWLSYRPARLHNLAKSIPWNWFLGSLKVWITVSFFFPRFAFPMSLISIVRLVLTGFNFYLWWYCFSSPVDLFQIRGCPAKCLHFWDKNARFIYLKRKLMYRRELVVGWGGWGWGGGGVGVGWGGGGLEV